MTSSPPRLRRIAMSLSAALKDCQFLQIDKLSDALFRKRREGGHAFFREGRLLRGCLNLNDEPLARKDEIGIGLGLRVLGIVEIQHRLALADAAGYGCNLVFQNAVLDHISRTHPLKAIMQRHPCAGNGRGSCASIGLQNVAIDTDLPLAESLQIDDGAERAANKALNFLAAPRLMSGCGFTACALCRRSRQHPILRRYPSASLPFQPGRNAVFEARRAKDVRIPKLDKARALRVKRESPLKAHGTKIVRLPFGGTH